jgi:hypothetical protein
MTVSDPLQDGAVASEQVTADAATKGFSQSILISAVRCLFTYILLPFATPLVGLTDIGPYIGIPLGLVAVAANVYSIRRFWAADHKWKRQVTVLHIGVLILLAFLLVNDVRELVS